MEVSLGWRAVEALVVAAFAFVAGYGLRLALALGVLVCGVSAAELVGARYGHAVALRHLALAVVALVLGVLALVHGAAWFAVVAVPVAAWLGLDALADADSETDRAPAATVEDADFAGELLRAVREDPRRPDELAADLDLPTPRVTHALERLRESGTVERDDRGRYRLVADAERPSTRSLRARLRSRLLRPVRAFAP